MSSANLSSVPSVQERIDALLEIHPKGYDLSLDRIAGLLNKLGNPQDRLPPVIHVAGTNGKGSTIAFTRSILEAAGLSIHVHTSPHLVSWNERYRIAGELVSDAELCSAIDRAAEANGGQAITVFEILTAVGFLLFSESTADACLMEVGLGGRFDSTNVMKNVAVSVITPVSIDHEMHLGDTFAKIAFEKAGIIKDRTPLVCGPQEDEALEMIERQAARHRAPLQVSGEDFHATAENGRFLFQDDAGLLDLALPRLPGPHQIDNAGTAIAAARAFAKTQGLRLREAEIETGVANASWPARMQRLTCGKLVELLPDNTELWLDGGHNAGAAVMIARHFCELNDKHSLPLILVCGMLSTKNPAAYFDQMTGLARKVYTVPITSSESGIDPAELAKNARNSGIDAVASSSIENALQKAAKEHAEMRVLIAGSLYTAGEALERNGTAPS